MKFKALLKSFVGQNVLVLGDLMLDEYIVGKATRISPEAPVMVVKQHRTFSVPGGAANVAKNVVALGGKATVVGVVGEDAAGIDLQEALGEHGFIIPDPNRPTTRKTRILADTAHQVLRIDHESEDPLEPDIEDAVLAAISDRMDTAQVVLLSDYTKGVLTPGVVAGVIQMAAKKGIPVVANAKPSSLPFYSGATLVSLNAREAADAVGVKDILRHSNGSGISDMPRETAIKLHRDHRIEHILITLGEYGMCTESFYVGPQKV
ncbi:MAG: bifunctional heptose 7-phosphate kinase/heptose 1-phosphate adenyltransferase, partial [Chlorobia bacterium]|nr:bifunctional heptose 7-phosphate kinase/heptose 1-phosphate adenyltransferase [Fimbriimonadaceae bacterium]